MSADTTGVLNDPTAGRQLGDEGMEVIASAPAQLTAYMRDQIARWGGVVRSAGVRVNRQRAPRRRGVGSADRP